MKTHRLLSRQKCRNWVIRGLFWGGLLFALGQQSDAQTLTERLQNETPEKLLDDALATGNSIRGAILFNRKSIECGRCHQSQASQPLGPALMGATTRELQVGLVESILNPDKSIKKGFESITLTTLDGRVISGLLIEETEEQIVIRDASTAGSILAFERTEIDEALPNERSLMPSNLPDQLRSREEFLDLVAYVVQLADQETIGTPHMTTLNTERQSLEGVLLGRVAFERHRCDACHETTMASHNERRDFKNRRLAPDLTDVVNRLKQDHVTEYLQNPSAVHPGTKMPSLLSGMEDQERQTAAEALTDYLFSLNEARSLPTENYTPSIERGTELFHSVGCVACHGPFGEEASSDPTNAFAPLGQLANKYTTAGLVQLLESPHQIRPSGRMPSLKLSHWEALDISAFLLGTPRLDSSSSSAEAEVDPARLLLGKQLFEELSCVRCHTQEPRDFEPIAIEDSKAGCLSNTPGTWPRYSLNEAEHAAITKALDSAAQPLTQTEALNVKLASFNCLACHSRDQFGGVAQEYDRFFQTTDNNLGQQGRIPPTLTGVGAKLKPDWLKDVLLNGRSIRPYMKTRMPQFGEDCVAELMAQFLELDRLKERPTSDPAIEIPDQKTMREAGLQMVGSQGLNCIACHTYRFEKSETMPAVDLTEMSERLNKAWFTQYMRAPQSFSPNTVMPTFWPDGNAARKDILDGNSDLQIEAIWTYLLEGRNARMPRGVIREPLALVAKDEAVMLRRAYPTIGKRGIGVGYPENVNLAFDAEQMRIALLWHGEFAEASGVWRGQGSGTVRPLGRQRLELPKGPELDSSSAPWEVSDGRPPDHQFEGYELDQLRRPAFLYRYRDIHVRDFSEPFTATKEELDGLTIDAPSKQQLQRRLQFQSASKEEAQFRIAIGNKIVDQGNNRWLIDDRMLVIVESSVEPEINVTEQGKQLVVPVIVDTYRAQVLVLKYLW